MLIYGNILMFEFQKKMEPMALGSPVNSTNPGQQPSGGGAQYLPGFLMGDMSIQVLINYIIFSAVN
jgi:hypothetical protein